MHPDISLPEQEEKELAANIGRELSQLNQLDEGQKISLVFRKGSKEVTLPFPIKAFELLMRILDQMAQGNSVTLIPVHALLTTQEAADLLNVSRPFVVKLLKEGKIPFVKVGSHRRIEFKELMKFKNQMLAESEKARNELAQLGQEFENENP